MLAQLRRAAQKVWPRAGAADTFAADEPVEAPAAAAREAVPKAGPANKMICLPDVFFPQRPDGPGLSSGVIYAATAELPPGRFVMRSALQFPDPLPEGVTISISVTGGGQTWAALEAPLDEALRTRADRIDIAFELTAVTTVTLEHRVNRCVGEIRLRYLDVQALEMWGRTYELDYAYPFVPEHDHFPPRRIRNVILGTIGVCNASCPHCPTNKVFSKHLEGGPMDMALFTDLIDQIAAANYEIEGVIGFGLHGDALMDPHVVDRARYVKEKLPRAVLLLNTNAGPWNERRHAELAQLVDIWSIHVEAMDPEVYARLMAPLRARIVMPKVERIIELAAGKVSIAVPLSKANRQEFRAIKAHFAALGATTMPLTFANRTTDVMDYYDYALAPLAGACRQEVAGELVVDWDGLVMACCQDFSRGNAIGDLRAERLSEVLSNQARRELFEKMRDGAWSDYRTCRDCKMDHPSEVARIAEEA